MKEQDGSKEKVRFLFDGDVTAEKIIEAIKAQLAKNPKKDEGNGDIPVNSTASETNGDKKP